MLSLFSGYNRLLEQLRKLWNINNKPKRLTIISSIVLWGFKLGTKLCCPLKIVDYQVLPSYSNVM